MPPQTAKIVVDLRRPSRANHESGRIIKHSPDLCIERFSASDLSSASKSVGDVELGHHDRAPRGIHLSEDFVQIPFHQIGKRLAQLWDPSQNIPFGLARGTSGATTV
jgi:hypothetical protein